METIAIPLGSILDSMEKRVSSKPPRSKWNEQRPDLSEGDVILVKDSEVHSNSWPLGRIVEAIKSEDHKVRKVKIAIYRSGHVKVILRPINKLVMILSHKVSSEPCTR